MSLNTNCNRESGTDEIDETVRRAGDSGGQTTRTDPKAGRERRFGFDRRCFVYTAHVPERRSGRERRNILETS